MVVVSRFNEGVTRRLLDGALGPDVTTANRRLLDGALEMLAANGYPQDAVDVIWVPGAFELPVTTGRALETERYRLAVALGAVIRGETPHFDFISAETTRGLGCDQSPAQLP